MQARAEQTRKTVLLAAATIFDQHGYAATSIDQIVEEAGVTKGALYFHFKSKAELAVAVVEAQYENWDWAQASVEARKLPPLELIDAVMAVAGQLLGTDPLTRAGMRLAQDARIVPGDLTLPLAPWINYMEPLFEQAQADGTLLAHIDCAAAARVVVAGLLGVQDMSDHLHRRADMVERVEEWWTHFMRPALTGVWPQPTKKATRKKAAAATAKTAERPGAEAAQHALARSKGKPKTARATD